MPYPIIGTTPTPYYIPTQGETDTIQTDRGYFYVQVYGAQAAFSGSFWVGAQNLAVMSQVNLHLGEQHDLGNQDLRSILQYRSIDKNKAVQLGFSPLLIDFVPARMKQISVSVEYLVDTQNYLATLAGLITNKDLLATISLAPGAAMAAKTIGTLTEKIIGAFVPQQQRQPILQFSGDFDLTDEGLKEGFYVILGSHTSKNPLPAETPNLAMAPGGILLKDGVPVTDLSYVILKVGCVKSIRDWYRGRATWRDKIDQARRQSKDYAEDPFADSSKEKQQEYWEKQILPLLHEAQILLSADPSFLSDEAELIYRAARKECLDNIVGKGSERKGSDGPTRSAWQPDEQIDRRVLGIPESENIDARLDDYADRLFSARQKFKELEASLR